MNKKKYTDLEWILTLFGTAIGAGIIFLPINIGPSGFIPLVIIVALSIFVVWLSHRALGYFIIASKIENSTLYQAFESNFGKIGGIIGNGLFFIFLFPVCALYSVGLTNTILSFIEFQLHIGSDLNTNLVVRGVVSFIIVIVIIFSLTKGYKLMVKITNALVYPLIVSLIIFSLLLIPQWNVEHFLYIPSAGQLLKYAWLALPVLIFSFNHSAALSPLVVDIAKNSPNIDESNKRINRIEFKTGLLLILFTIMFAGSCALALDSSEFGVARAQNLSILSYVANKSNSIFIMWLGPLVAFTAIGSSFFAHLNACLETAEKLVFTGIPEPTAEARKKSKYFILPIMFVLMVLSGIFNPNIIKTIEGFGGPITAIILFIIPIVGIYTCRNLAIYKKFTISNIFVFVIGIIILLSITVL